MASGKPRVMDEYSRYRKLLDDQYGLHPQHQGLSQNEFDRALVDPATHWTSVTVDGSTVRLPQLQPIDNFGWLNRDFFLRRFPREAECGALLHFTHFAGVEVSRSVRSAAQEIAAAGGVIVIDVPGPGPHHEERAVATLETLGISIAEREKLGTQTYFCSQVRLRGGGAPGEPEEALHDAAIWLDPVVRSGNEGNRARSATTTPIVDAHQALHLQRLYEAAYVVLNDDPCSQGLDPEQFHAMLLDPEIGKWVVVSEGLIETICLTTSKLHELDWINLAYYEHRYPGPQGSRRLVWFPGIATDPSRQGSHNFQLIMDLMARAADATRNEFVGLFDFCQHNTGSLDVALEAMINATPEASTAITPVETQLYVALRPVSA